MSNGALTPRQIVAELDAHIVGQDDAKRAVAVALRNRWRRRNLAADLVDEVMPRNILMIGPTGVGKTEIARRLAKLAGAPFLKVEASKFTEVGYVGRDVESIIRDLVDEGYRLVRDAAVAEVADGARASAEARLLDLLEPGMPAGTPEWQAALQRLRDGGYDDREVEVDVADAPKMPFEMFGAGPGMEEMERNLRDMFSQLLPRNRRRSRLRVPQALRVLTEEASERELDEERLRQQAVELVQNEGIVFIDEIDKVARGDGGKMGPDVSGEGVQRDLLPIVEGSTVTTRLGPVKTDHILFIAAGAFHVSRPSDLIPELQGRFPIRVELEALDEDDLYRILAEPRASLIRQAQALLATEGVQVAFDDEAIREIAAAATRFNSELENIGARRLHTIVERVLEEISFAAPELDGQTIPITRQYVQERLAEIDDNRDLARYIL
ncbi:MAG: ATP-dependent protease ATPase subunit HslU [Candidatus Dadabacteria bacterium]|nr:MAG: ATP-dependent protease ATPase subunit HslU [Candidatus Dadabacteria bacterium]